MAAARDQAARILRPESDTAGNEIARDPAADLAESFRTQFPEETVARRSAEAPSNPAIDNPAAAPVAAVSAALKSGKRKRVLIGIGSLLALAAAAYGVHYVLVGRFFVSTDDAYVRANNTMLGARVSGHVAAILPGDNVLVRTGDVIFRIDDGDYRIAVDAARTKIATQQATIDRIGRQVTALESAVEQAKAQLASADAALKRAGLDFERQQALSTKGFASRATYEVSEAGRDQGMAAVKSAQAAYDAARDNVEVTKAQQAEARALLAELQTSLAKAERDLDFTSVRAPVDGTFSNRLVNTGDFVVMGQRLGNEVPLNDVFIDANVKETPLKRIPSRRRPARCSRCCRLITPPATSPRSCSGFRFGFACRRMSPGRTCCARACRSMRPSIPATAPRMRTTRPISMRRRCPGRNNLRIGRRARFTSTS